MAKKIDSVIAANGKVYTKVFIKEKIATSDAWLYRAILAIYAGQTAEEQNMGGTVEDNGIGFNAVDAGFMTQLALSLKHHNRLTAKQIAIGRRIIMKYVGQLLKLIH